MTSLHIYSEIKQTWIAQITGLVTLGRVYTMLIVYSKLLENGTNVNPLC